MTNEVQNWLFLRGLCRETAHWEGFLDAFERGVPGARCFALDLPGNGEFHQLSSPASIAPTVEFLRDQWAKRAPDGGPVHVFALSLGAMVAIDWMNRYPSEVASAVLVNTSLRALSPFYRRISPAGLVTLLRVFTDPDVRRRESKILELTSQQSWDESALARRTQSQKIRPVTRANAIRQILAAARCPIDADQRPAQPVLILNSLGDTLVHPDCSRALAKAWGAPLRRHAWAGHDLPLDDPQWTVRAVSEWLSGVARQPEQVSVP